tara:strand:- start:199 stop:474 length:276 start_codon:yes stop_codon:yes gene_type:complete
MIGHAQPTAEGFNPIFLEGLKASEKALSNLRILVASGQHKKGANYVSRSSIRCSFSRLFPCIQKVFAHPLTLYQTPFKYLTKLLGFETVQA